MSTTPMAGRAFSRRGSTETTLLPSRTRPNLWSQIPAVQGGDARTAVMRSAAVESRRS